VRARSSLRLLAVVGLIVLLAVLGTRNVQIVNFHLFFGLLVASIAAVLVIFAVTGERERPITVVRRKP
jgi:hypothetical protein